MNNNSYHHATETVLNWKRLSIYMKARYSGWIVKSTCSWTVNYWVVITEHNGRKVSRQYGYPFEYRKDAEECMKWWSDNTCTTVLKEVTHP